MKNKYLSVRIPCGNIVLPSTSIDPNPRPPGILKRKTPEADPLTCKHGATPGDPKRKPPGGG